MLQVICVVLLHDIFANLEFGSKCYLFLGHMGSLPDATYSLSANGERTLWNASDQKVGALQ